MQRTPSANSSGPGPVSLSRARGSTRPRQMHSPGTQPGALTASWCSPARSRAVCANAGATPVSKASASQVIGTRSNLEILGTVPLMPDIPHDESTIELYTSLGESCLVGKVAGMYFLDLERLHPPAVGSKKPEASAREEKHEKLGSGPPGHPRTLTETSRSLDCMLRSMRSESSRTV